MVILSRFHTNSDNPFKIKGLIFFNETFLSQKQPKTRHFCPGNEGDLLIQNIRNINNDGELVSEKNKHFSDSMNDEGYRFPSHKAGARFFRDVHLPKLISYQDKGRLYDLSQLMVGNTNLIGYKLNSKIHGYTEDEIGSIVELSGKRGREFVRRMVQNKIIKKLDAGYYMNPAFFMSTGQRLSLDLFINFQEELIPLLPNWAIDDFLRQAEEKKV